MGAASPPQPSDVHRVLAAFPDVGEVLRVEPFAGGLMNQTFGVVSSNGTWVVQRLNPVFDPRIHENMLAVTERLRERGIVAPRLLLTEARRAWLEEDGLAWRVMTRLPGVAFAAVRHSRQAHAAAGALAAFHAALVDLDHTFVGLRHGVHDTAKHLENLRFALDECSTHQLHADVARLGEQLLAQADALPSLADQPTRVVHGDPKFNNILFEGADEPQSSRVVALIDFDTVAPMPLALELGDAWRSWCNPKGEDERQARFDLAIYEAAVQGYAQVGARSISLEEQEGLVHGVEWITLELACRFATDALRESYFGWDSSRFVTAGEHNLVRAQGQWSLHAQVMAVRDDRRAILKTQFERFRNHK